MRLPVPARVKDVLYTECELTSPTVNVIAETRRVSDSGNYFSSLRPFCNGCITQFRTADGRVITDPVAIKAIVMQTPYKSIETLSIQAILLHYSEDDGVEGVYHCPRCGAEIICEIREEDGVKIDTRDHIRDLPINYLDPETESMDIHLVLTEPVQIIDKKDNSVIMEVNDMDVQIPTLENCIAAEGRVGARDFVKLQIAIYVEALKKVNGEAVDNKFRSSFGMHIFGNMNAVKRDLGVLADNINRYGIDRGVQKECRMCGKVWKATLNTSNFFDGAPLMF